MYDPKIFHLLHEQLKKLKTQKPTQIIYDLKNVGCN